jgi:phage-related minor tail protein
MDAVPGTLKRIEEEYKRIDDVVKDFTSGLTSSWSNAITGMIKGTETFSSAMKKMFQGIAEAFISAVSQMITKWILFGSITGEKGGTSFFGKSASGWGGLVGGLLHLVGLQHGGIVTRPTPAIVGESGPEAVIPLRGGKISTEGGGNYTMINIHATDVRSFEDQLKRNPNAIMEIIYKNARKSGAMKDIVRSMS